MVRELKMILDNHQKLLSMINDKMLPIKASLLQDVQDMRKILETPNRNKKEVKK